MVVSVIRPKYFTVFLTICGTEMVTVRYVSHDAEVVNLLTYKRVEIQSVQASYIF